MAGRALISLAVLLLAASRLLPARGQQAAESETENQIHHHERAKGDASLTPGEKA